MAKASAMLQKDFHPPPGKPKHLKNCIFWILFKYYQVKRGNV